MQKQKMENSAMSHNKMDNMWITFQKVKNGCRKLKIHFTPTSKFPRGLETIF